MDLGTHQLLRQLLVVVAASLALLITFVAGLSYFGRWSDERAYASYPVSYNGCNIAVVPIQGDIIPYDGYYTSDPSSSAPIATSGDWVDRYVRAAAADPNIKGILVPIDSYGGLASPALQMLNAFSRAPVPVVAYIREMGTSAAYMAALGADTIIASPLAQVGSIGVTYSYVSNYEQNKKEGLTYIQLSSGPYKDAGSPDKPLTDDERALYERDLKIYANQFIDLVAAHRKLSTTTVAALADGQIWPATLALQNGLVDQLGDEDTARAWFSQELSIDPEGVIFCN